MKYEELWSALDAEMPRARALRGLLHRNPRPSGNETETRDLVIEHLPQGLPRTTVAEAGAVVRCGGPGPAIGIRGELDALPILEETGVDWASENPGVMHACGHDVHLAALTAVVHAVASTEAPMPLLAVLQPREETYPSGAEDIVASGILRHEECAAMLGAHVQPTLERDVVSCTPEGVNAAADEFHIEVSGRPGHAAYPHTTRDPLYAGTQIVGALQSVVGRVVDPMRSAVVGVSSFHAGEAANVVPERATISGTLRALDEETRALIRAQVREIAVSTSAAHGCTAKVTITAGEPVLYNDPTLAEATAAILAEQGFDVDETLRSLGADDFSFFAEKIPSLMLFVGTETTEGLHSSTFLPNDDDVYRVARAMMSGYLALADAVA